MSRLSLVTDGTAEAAALAAWLTARVPDAELIEAKSPADADRTAALRRRGRARVIVLGAGAQASDVPAEAALRWARDRLAPLSPIQRRIQGPDRLAEQSRDDPDDAEPALALLRAVSGRAGPPRGRGRRRAPFTGVELDVAVAMLCEPERSWTERDLAAAIERAPSAAHKALAAFARSGYLRRRRGETAPRDPIVLRDALLDPWRRAVGLPREARGLVFPPRFDLARAAKLLERSALPWALAGASAGSPDATVVEPGTTIYADEDAIAALTDAGCTAGNASVAPLRIWLPHERAIFYAPRTIDGLPATNRVITYLDLAMTGVDRYVTAAEAAWQELP